MFCKTQKHRRLSCRETPRESPAAEEALDRLRLRDGFFGKHCKRSFAIRIHGKGCRSIGSLLCPPAAILNFRQLSDRI